MRIKKVNLVCQYLENISKDVLRKHAAIIKKYVKGRHGIYALYRKNHLYYVGLASNLSSRLRGHLNDRHAKSWDRFSVYLTTGDKHLRELETLILRIIDKKGNRLKGKFGYAEDLRRKLHNDLRKEYSFELENILCRRHKTPKQKRKIRDLQKVSGRTPTLAPFVTKSFKIVMEHNHKTYKAFVRRNGSIFMSTRNPIKKRYKGKVFTSPSLAAKAIVGHAQNGWAHWLYERAPGDWVPLSTLRG